MNRYAVVLALILLLLLAGCSTPRPEPPAFILDQVNLPPNIYYYKDQEISGKLADQQFQGPVLIVSIAPELPENFPIPNKPVMVAIMIDIEGNVEELTILESLGEEIDNIILDNLKYWHFDPAFHKESGEKVPCRIVKPIYFRTAN